VGIVRGGKPVTGAWPAAGDNGDASPVMTATARPLPGCPARRGKGADTTTADFVLVADDCISGPDGQPTVTEVFGYFRLPGEEHDDDVLLTAGLEVPAGSPAAAMAHGVSADPGRTRTAGMLLRRNVARCPCAARGDCPALDEARLLEALEHAAGRGLAP
jgi:hypothetical protein